MVAVPGLEVPAQLPEGLVPGWEPSFSLQTAVSLVVFHMGEGALIPSMRALSS